MTIKNFYVYKTNMNFYFLVILVSKFLIKLLILIQDKVNNYKEKKSI